MCKTRSKTFKGECFHSINCANICTSEGATGGFCEGHFYRECMCITNQDCDGNGGGNGCDNGGGNGGDNGGGGGPPQQRRWRPGGSEAMHEQQFSFEYVITPETVTRVGPLF
ncbi:hypothetical protein PR202_ga06591 [Eleusine coracana subsp. coracana]|uniref:Knottins-like domain-containing protein n=1 Tax=Eleusine coracana subsp. coracana TaxID=191504 RepID=A0AAV5BYU4_ELECO|nr:hypothetical protein PR202_ga06591 [Eleusine coracana subsp. coracana]